MYMPEFQKKCDFQMQWVKKLFKTGYSKAFKLNVRRVRVFSTCDKQIYC